MLVACPIHVMRLVSSAKQRKYLTDHGHTSLDFCQVESREMEVEGEDAKLRKDMSQYVLTSSEVVPPRTKRLQTFSSSRQKERVSSLIWAMLSFCGLLRKFSQSYEWVRSCVAEKPLEMLSGSCPVLLRFS